MLCTADTDRLDTVLCLQDVGSHEDFAKNRVADIGCLALIRKAAPEQDTAGFGLLPSQRTHEHSSCQFDSVPSRLTYLYS